MSLWLSIPANQSLDSDTLLYQIHSEGAYVNKKAIKQEYCWFISVEPQKMCWHLGLVIDWHNDSDEAHGQGS